MQTRYDNVLEHGLFNKHKLSVSIFIKKPNVIFSFVGQQKKLEEIFSKVAHLVLLTYENEITQKINHMQYNLALALRDEVSIQKIFSYLYDLGFKYNAADIHTKFLPTDLRVEITSHCTKTAALILHDAVLAAQEKKSNCCVP